ncbi:DNA translocase FtsK [Bengtsoniella intestinalis]|uniref:DNA translocase FtsK n=1 Tax=Bengtsoniella intestinalis TaxID=3073143 RepID=UPI00391F0B79
MIEKNKYEEQYKKLVNLCEEHDLTFRLRKDSYPVTLTILPLTDMEHQMCMLETVEANGYISPDASIKLWVEDSELKWSFSESFAITDVLQGKIKGIFVKMHRYWMQAFFREVVEKKLLSPKVMPTSNDSGLPEEAQSIEDFDTEDDNDVLAFDALVEKATQLVRAEGMASHLLLQQRLNISYSLAGEVMEMLEAYNVVGPQDGNNPREVFMDETLVPDLGDTDVEDAGPNVEDFPTEDDEVLSDDELTSDDQEV